MGRGSFKMDLINKGNLSERASVYCLAVHWNPRGAF